MGPAFSAVGLAGDPGGPGPWSAGSPWFGSWSAGLVGPVPGPVGGLSVAVIIMVWRSWGLAGVPGSWVGGPGRSVRILVLAPGILVGRPVAARPGFAGIAGSTWRSGHLPIPFKNWVLISRRNFGNLIFLKKSICRSIGGNGQSFQEGILEIDSSEIVPITAGR